MDLPSNRSGTIAICLLLLISATSAFGAFGYSSTVTIDHTKVPSTQTDFPVLISITDARFKTVGNSGHVENANGYDIRPFSDNACSSALTYQLAYYSATAGTIEMWVKIASLSSSVDTVIYMGYGDAGITTDGSSTTTWSNNFHAVYHLADGTTLSTNGSTSPALNLTNNNAATATTGQIDGAGSFASASSQSLNTASGGDPGSAFTLSAWVKATSFPNAYNAVIGFGPTSTFALFVKSNGKLACYLQAGGQVSYDGTGSHTLSTGTWYYLVMTYSSSAGLVGYVDGASDGTGAANGTSAAHGEMAVSNDPVTSGRNWNGAIDEPRTAAVSRAQDWITTEYNNQSNPGTFETLGTEGVGCPLATATPTATSTPTPTNTPTPTTTFTPTPSATFTPTATPTNTPTPTATPTNTPTPTASPVATATATPTPTPTPLANPWFFFFPQHG